VYVVGSNKVRLRNPVTESIHRVFRRLEFYGNLSKYGIDEREDGSWGGFLKPVLKKLAEISKN